MEWDQVDVTGVVTGNVHSEDLYRQSVASLKRNKVGLKGRMVFLFVVAEFRYSSARTNNPARRTPYIIQRLEVVLR